VGSVSAVVFDIGGVLLDWDPRHFYRKLFGGDETAMEQFLTRVCSPQWHAAQDLGYGIAQACGELAARHRDQAGLILAWAGHTEDMVAGSIAGSVAVLADLKQRGVSCYALSNMEAETFPLRLRKFSFLRWFDGYVISGLEGMAKPDPRIYRLLLQRYELLAAQTQAVRGPNQPIELHRDQAGITVTLAELGFFAGAGERNRTLMTSLEDRWHGIGLELRKHLSWLRPPSEYP
jgi:2-haloacid dehalogenase